MACELEFKSETQEEDELIQAEAEALSEYLRTRVAVKSQGLQRALSMALLHEATHGMIHTGCPAVVAMRQFCVMLEHAIEARDEGIAGRIGEIIEKVMTPETPKEERN